MNRISSRVFSALFILLFIISIVACNGEAKPQTPKNCVVTFDSEGGSSVEPVTVTEGQKVKQPVAPTKDGLIFGGWWTKTKSGSFSSKYVFSTKVKDDITLYARWYTTQYFMPAGWSVDTPMWTSKDAGTVIVPDVVLKGDFQTPVTNVTDELKTALAAAVADPEYFKPAKNIIIIISDGMGISHVKASEKWSGELIMTQFPNVGASNTRTREGEVTDSAAGGTAISAGYKTTKLFVSMDAEGNNLKTVSELAREQGKLVGIVTNAELADATPAVFSVHSKNRSQGWTKMCQQQVVFGADLFMGNGFSDYSGYFSSKSPLYKFTVDNKIKLYYSANNIINNFDKNEKMWAVFKGTGNKFARFDTTDTDKPNLQQMTAYALSWLDYQNEHNNDDKGFVVMIENTYTDHFGHGNAPLDSSSNTFGIVKEVQSTDEAVAIALKYVLEHPDTALIVTADHETGNTTLDTGWETNFSKISAVSGNHSDQTVPVFAIGKGTEALNRLNRTETERAAGLRWAEAEQNAYENCIIGQVIGQLLGDASFGGDVANENDGKTSAKFDISVTNTADKLTFDLELKGAPITENYVYYSSSDTAQKNPCNDSIIQFKIQAAPSDKIAIELRKADGTYVSQLAATEFSKAESTLTKDGAGNYITPISPAYKQAFVSSSGKLDGWYQISLPAVADSTQIRIILTPGSGSFSAGTVIGMDDLTIQYGSTIGELLFSSDNATATGDCLIHLK